MNYDDEKTLADISPEAYRLAQKTLNPDITAPYENLLKLGYGSQYLLNAIAKHVEAIRNSKAPEDDKDEALGKLYDWVADRCLKAPDCVEVEDWETANGQILPDLSTYVTAAPTGKEWQQQLQDWNARLSGTKTQLRQHYEYSLDQDQLLSEGFILAYEQKDFLNERAPSMGRYDTASIKTPTAKRHKSQVFWHPELRVAVGNINGKSFPAMGEKQLFKHLTTKHGFKPVHAADFIAKIKAGNQSGFGPAKPEHHINMAHHHALMASNHYASGNDQMKDKHMLMVDQHLDKAMDLTGELVKTKKLRIGKNHPIAKGIHAIHDIVRGMQ